MSDPTTPDPSRPAQVPPAQPDAEPTAAEPAAAPAPDAAAPPAPETPAAPPAYSPPEPPAYSAPEPPAYAAPEQPAYSTPEPPAYAAPEQPAYGAPEQQPPYAAPGQPAPAQPVYAAPGVQPGYAPPAPPAYGAPPSYGPPVPPGPAAGRPKILAIIALVAAGVGFIAACIPFVAFGAGVFLLAGFIMGLIALISKKQGGKGFSIAAVIVSVVGWIVAIVMVIVSIGLFGNAVYNAAVTDGLSGNGQSGSGGSSGGGSQAASDAQDLEIDEAVFGQDTDDGTWWYVIILNNPNDDYVFSYAEIDVEALDASGTTVDTDSNYLTVLSGQTAITGWFLDTGDAVVDDLYVSGPTASDAVVSPLEDTGTLSFSNLDATSDDYYTTVTGTLGGDFEDDLDLPLVTVVARDGSGNIIGGAYTYTDTLPAGGSVDFEVSFYESYPAGTTFEAYGAL